MYMCTYTVDGCLCQCIFQCTTRTQIMTLLESNVVNYEFLECTTQVKSEDEAEAWKQSECDESQTGPEFQRVADECNRNGTRPACVKQGVCIRSVCKFCYRWECLDSESDAKSPTTTSGPAPLGSGLEMLKRTIIHRLRKAWGRLAALN